MGAGVGGGGTISAVNPLVSLRDSLNNDDDRAVFSVRTEMENTSDLYLRIVSLDDFDGTTWKPSKRAITQVPEGFPARRGSAPTWSSRRSARRSRSRSGTARRGCRCRTRRAG